MSNYHGIEEFVLKFQTAKNQNSKEIRLSIQEAERLSTSISLVLARELTLSSKIIELQNQIIEQQKSEQIDISFEGGNF